VKDVMQDMQIAEGIGTQLVEFALEDARSRDLTVVPQCPFAAAVMSGRAEPYKDR
jgi:predicted GNAT family acetyltransferase